MKLKLILVLMLAPLTGLAEHPPESPMDKLDWLLGEWTFEDVSVDGSYRETGSRTCTLTLHDQYILCESIGVSHNGHERSYYFILGFNRMDGRYEMIGLTSSYPRQNLYIIVPNENGDTLELTNHFWTEDGVVPSNTATITYNGSDQYVWQIRSGEVDPATGQKAVGFIDTVTKLPFPHTEP